MRAHQEKLKAEKGKLLSSDSSYSSTKEDHHGMTQADSKIAAEIRKRAEAEAERKMKSGNFTSGPGIKSLGDIIDISKIESDSPSTITQLWTQYHTLKNKISAVIPAKQYAQMAQNARKYPQFLLPLPRTIVGSLYEDQSEAANVGPGERKQGYEMQYMQWSFLPPPPKIEALSSQETSVSLTEEERQHIEQAAPTTVLFTPLAEYKLRQEYAQPVLILTHYTDLALSKGIVLLRGEVTGAEEAAAATTGIAAVTAATQAGNVSPEKIEKLKKPLQSQGKLSPQDAQLLTVTLQRFYMPKISETAAKSNGIPGEQERQELLHAFHNDQEKFDIDRLCTYSLLT
jgi:ATP synthase F1 complex assembly factor 1